MRPCHPGRTADASFTTQVLNSRSLGSRLPSLSMGLSYRPDLKGEGWPLQRQVGGGCKMTHILIMLPANQLVGFPTPFFIKLLQIPEVAGGARCNLALSRSYSWGRGQSSGHRAATTSSKEWTGLQAFDISQCTDASQEPPSHPCPWGWLMQKWSSLLRVLRVPWKPTQILGSHDFLIIGKKKSWFFSI